MITLQTLIQAQLWPSDLIQEDQLQAVEKLINLWLINQIEQNFEKSGASQLILALLTDADWSELLALARSINRESAQTLSESLHRLQFVLKPSS